MANNIEVWDITFYKVDDEGEPLLNEDGSVKLFQDTKGRFDLSWISDVVDEDMLQEISE
tara:strand:- start:349 stop:525 length:177 start_codon:yes stop_codon:yes gene_type:complete